MNRFIIPGHGCLEQEAQKQNIAANMESYRPHDEYQKNCRRDHDNKLKLKNNFFICKQHICQFSQVPRDATNSTHPSIASFKPKAENKNAFNISKINNLLH